MSLSKCIRKSGKTLNQDDASAIKDIYSELTQGGMPGEQARVKAVDMYLAELQEENSMLLEQAEELGGDVSPFKRSAIQLAATDLNKEVARDLSVAASIDAGTKMPGLPKDVTTRSFAKYLSKRARKANRGKPLNGTTPRNKDIISEVLANETAAAMARSGHAGNWYSDTLGDAMSIASLIHPELETDTNARNAFLVGMAITSNGMTVNENTKYAEQVYAYFKKHGRFQDWGVGAESGAMKKGFKLYNEMAAKWGNRTINEFLHSQFTVAELELLGFKISGENKEAVVYGSAVFGPKVGQAFFQNLSGNYSPLTMDRWWMRTWGRIVGNLAPEGKGESQAQVLRERLTEKDAKAAGFDYDMLQQNDAKLAAFALKLHRAYARGGFKDKTDLNKAAKNYDNALNDPIVAPRNGAERAWIREVVAEAIAKLKDRGMDLNTASMQALLWYPEKEFYLLNGVGNEKSKPTDYSIEFGKLAEGRGISKQRVEAARSRAVAGRAARDVDAPGQPAVERQRGPALAKQARQQLIHIAAARGIAELDKGAYSSRVPKGTERFVDGAPVVHSHKPQLKAANTLKRAGLPAPTFLELDHSQKSAAVFQEKLRAAVKGVKTIRVFAVEEYENMRTFLSPDGLSGFALNGEELVSVFKHPDSDMKGLAQPMVRLAVEQGARRLGVYDSAIPHVYSMQGFRAVSRTPSDLGPDLVFMVWDRNSQELYAPNDGEKFATVQEARAKSIEEAANLMTRNAPSGSIKLRLSEELENATDQGPVGSINKLAAAMQDNQRHGPNGGRTLRQMVGDLLPGKNAVNYERALALIPRRHIQDFISKRAMPFAKKYIQSANRMDGRRNELITESEEVGERFAAYVSADKDKGRILGELMHGATLSGVDPSAQYKSLFKDPRKMDAEQRKQDTQRRSDHKILQMWWRKMDPDGQQIYIDVRNSYLKQRTKVEKALMDRIAATKADPKQKGALMLKLRKQFESGRVAGAYFPLSRFGDLWASAKNAKGEVIGFAKFEHLSDQKAWVAAQREAGFVVDSGKKMDDAGIVRQVDPGFASKVADMAKKVEPALADDIWQLYLRSMPEMSIRKGFMHRKGRLGFTTDALRAFGHNMFHGAHQLAKLEYMHELEANLEGMKANARRLEQANDPEALWGNAVYREMVKRHEWAKNPVTSPLATKLTALGFVWYLGATPAAAAVNLTQTAIVAMPVLGAKFGNVAATAQLSKAMTLWATSRGKMVDRLRGDEQKAFQEATRIGLFDKSQAHDLAGTSEDTLDFGSVRAKTMHYVSWMFHKIEQGNREATFLAGYRLARDAGMTHNDAILQSEDMVWDSHFDYNSSNRPRVMQGDWPRVLFLFRQYSMNMTYRLSRDFRDGILRNKSLTVAERNTALKRFSGIMGMTALFSGTTGLPMFWAVEAMMNAIFGDEDEPYDFVDDTRAYLAEMTSPDIADVIMKGAVDKLSGMTVSSRVSLNNLWLREAPAHLEGAELWTHYIEEVAGPIPSAAGGVFKAASEYARGSGAHRTIEAMTPKVIKDITKASRYAGEGVQNRRGDVIIGKEELTNKDLFVQAAGFTPAKITKQYEQNRAVKNAERKILDRSRSLMDHLFIAARDGDKRDVKEVMQKIVRFNRKNPAIAIDAGKIIASAKARARYSAQSVGGVTVNKNLRYLHGKYEF